MFEVSALNINRGWQSATQGRSRQVSQSTSGGSESGSSSSGSSSSSSSSGGGGGAATTPFGSQIITQTQSGYWVELTGTLRSEEHTAELQSLMRISYAVFCLTKKKRPELI